MRVFITGTDTNIGKTLVCSWLCLHTGYSYFKPIQTGASEGTDSLAISSLVNVKIYKEIYVYKEPLSPNFAALIEGKEIDITKIKLPEDRNLIVEGAGGLLVPINKDYLMIDLIKYLQIPVIIIASSRLGTINHTLLSLEALKVRNIETLGVIMSGPLNADNSNAIEFYGNTKVLAQIPLLDQISKDNLRHIPLTEELQSILKLSIALQGHPELVSGSKILPHGTPPKQVRDDCEVIDKHSD